MQQLTLNVGMRDGQRFRSFFATPENAELLSVLKSLDSANLTQVFLWGEAQAGKSHLLQACCELYYSQGLMAAYLPLARFAAGGIPMLEGLEHKDFIAIDDLDAVIGDKAWEMALMRLINQCRANNQRLLLAARTNPRTMECALPDLASRLLWGPSYRVTPLQGGQAIQAMVWRARQRGFDLPEHVIKYIERHYARDMATLMALLERLDNASLTHGRKITREFVRAIMCNTNQGDHDGH